MPLQGNSGMKLEIRDQLLRIECVGIELLKLKSSLARRLGNGLISGRDFVAFPLAAMPLVEDLIPGMCSDSPVADALFRYRRHSEAREKALELIESGETTDMPPDWSGILEPAQALAVAAMTVGGLLGLCLFDEQGSGKTVMTIAAFDKLREEDAVDAMVVVCPKSMVGEWPKDIAKFLGDKYAVVVAGGGRRDKYEAALQPFDVLVTNFEGLCATLTPLCSIAGSRRVLLVVDESYHLKNEQATRSGTARTLRAKCERCFVLCGTPAPHSAHDLVNQFNLADLGYTFGLFRRSSNPEHDWEEIARLVDSRGVFVRRLKGEILEYVPSKNFHVLRTEMSGKQSMLYEEGRSKLELDLRNLNDESFKKSLASYLSRRSTLLQICACPGAVDPTYSDVPAKYLALDPLLAQLIGENRKVVIWSFYRHSLDELEARYGHYGAVRVDGSVPAELREAAVRAFQTDPNVMLFIGNPAAAGAGITLHASFDAVYVSYSNQAAHYLQSLDRIHRRGQVAEEVNYYLLVCRGTVEEAEVIRLRGKELDQHRLLGDHIPWPVSLDVALQELTANG